MERLFPLLFHMWCPAIPFLAKLQAYSIPSPPNSQWYFGKNKIWIQHPGRTQQPTNFSPQQHRTVWLLCHVTIDALAVACIWSFLLRKDGIAHHIVPCAGPAIRNRHLVTRVVAVSAAVIVLGCGAHLIWGIIGHPFSMCIVHSMSSSKTIWRMMMI